MTTSPTLDSITISQLRTEFDSRLIEPEDPGYDAARTLFAGGFDHRPAVILQPNDADEVARIVAVARDTGAELAVRSGGHSALGHSVSHGGITIDLSRMRGLDVDVDGRTAWAGAGLTAGEYTKAVAEHGLATGFGDTGSVGLGGIILGGGVGFLSRLHGLTIEDLLAAEVVTADGQILLADADHHPELFWALRGGGGNFGVVTKFQLRLHAVSSVVGGMLMLPATPAVVQGFLTAAAAAPDELSTIANVMPAPPMPFIPAEYHGKPVVFGLMCYAGDEADGERAVAPFRELATPIVDMVKPISYPEMYAPDEGDYHPTAVARTLYADAVDHEAIQTIVKRIESSTAAMRVVQLRVLGGAIDRVPADATAYAHRGRALMINVAAFYDGPDDRPEREAWVADLVTALRNGPDGAYVNFLAEDGAARIREAYPGATWDRLVEVKRRYDPTNLFRLNQNISPDPA